MDINSFENYQALIIQQALLGSVSNNVRFVSFEVINNGISIYCILEKESACDREEFEDLIPEIEAHQEGPIDISLKIDIKEEPIYVDKISGRPVYMRKEYCFSNDCELDHDHPEIEKTNSGD